MARTYLNFLWIVEWDVVHHMTVWNISINVGLKKKTEESYWKLTGISDNAGLHWDTFPL